MAPARPPCQGTCYGGWQIGNSLQICLGKCTAIFLRPLRAIAHLTVLRKTDMKKDNEDYEQVKEKVAAKYGFFSAYTVGFSWLIILSGFF